MLHELCAMTGARIIGFCQVTGRMMMLFLDTLSKVRTVSIKETLRQMALLGADSLPIVLLTMLCTGMVFSVQTAKEFVALGASGTVGGIVAIAMGRELVPVLTGVVYQPGPVSGGSPFSSCCPYDAGAHRVRQFYR